MAKKTKKRAKIVRRGVTKKRLRQRKRELIWIEEAAVISLEDWINLRGNWPQEQINLTGQSSDERMNWTLADVGRLFPVPRIELPPLVSSNK